MAANRVLIIVTNVGEYETVGLRTGLWLGELTHFYDVLEQAGYALDIASPRGGFVPIDPESLARDVLAAGGTGKRYADRAFMDLLEDTKKVADVRAEDYDAVYLTGGHGVMFDFRRRDLAELVARFHDTGRVVSAVCHGPAGLIDVRLDNGEPLVKDRDVTGFSWAEEQAAQRDHAVPYSLQDELVDRGGRYSVADKLFDTYVVEDDRLITGQNPASARAVGEAVVRRLGKD